MTKKTLIFLFCLFPIPTGLYFLDKSAKTVVEKTKEVIFPVIAEKIKPKPCEKYHPEICKVVFGQKILTRDLIFAGIGMICAGILNLIFYFK